MTTAPYCGYSAAETARGGLTLRLEHTMNNSIQETELESNLADLRDIPLAEIADAQLVGVGTIPARDDISAFNSSL
jgi:hypothetical protein